MSKYEDMSDDYLRKTYVPDVYQKSIFSVDYEILKKKGIKVLSFDIDGTIAKLRNHHPPKETISLFVNLKNAGFEIFLLSNTHSDHRAENFGEILGVDCIYYAHKPCIDGLEEIRDRYFQKYHTQLQKEQMAHIGNSILSDVASGNTFGAVTVLVRHKGTGSKITANKGRRLRHELKERGIWRKHHKYEDDDQYYQLGEVPPYKR